MISAALCQKKYPSAVGQCFAVTGCNEPQKCLSDALISPPPAAKCLTTVNALNLSGWDAGTAPEA